MGVAISALVEGKETNLDEFQGKIIAVDAMNMLYQFATTIRQYDGTPLKDSKGNITSHLTGLFSRCMKLMQKNIKLVFVFDGVMPPLKEAERARRETEKLKAITAFKEAESKNDVDMMKKLASRTVKVTSDMVEESKELLKALGIPVIVAPSEGEAQAAYMVAKGDCDFVASQDYDCLIYGAPNIVRNLSISNKRKKINAVTYTLIQPEILSLHEVLQSLELSLKQLQALAMLVGTDFNIGGVKGLGPKKGLQLVKQHGDDIESLFKEVEFDEKCGVAWQDVFKVVSEMPTTDDYSLSWQAINKEALIDLLVTKHEFRQERIDNALEELDKVKKSARQTSLGKFF